MFPRRKLAQIKAAPKRLADAQFSPHKKSKLGTPLDKVPAGGRISTPLVPLGDDLYATFIARATGVYESRKIFGFLLKGIPGKPMTTLLRLDWHPSHKGLHCIINCEDERDLAGRNLVGCKELTLKPPLISLLDPADEDHRREFIRIFCAICNVQMGSPGLML